MIPEVKKCSVSQCFFNKENECRAHSVLVGSEEPTCETFAQSGQHSNNLGQSAVGACHITKCEYNHSMSCHACSDIEIGWQDNSAKCLTYEPRMA